MPIRSRPLRCLRADLVEFTRSDSQKQRSRIAWTDEGGQFWRADGVTIRCELWYQDEFGIAAPFFCTGELVISRRFDTRALVQ